MSKSHIFKQNRGRTFNHAASQTQPSGKAFNNGVKPGQIIYFRMDKAAGVGSSVFTPGIITAIWRTSIGNAEAFEVIPICRRLDKGYLKRDLAITPGLGELALEKFHGGKIDMGTIVFVKNTCDVVSKPRKGQAAILSIWPDILVRRAYALLWCNGLRLLGERPSTDFIREGHLFDDIALKFTASNKAQPDIPAYGAKAAEQDQNVKDAVNACARFANIYLCAQQKKGNASWAFPHHSAWGNNIPSTWYYAHQRNIVERRTPDMHV